MILKSALQIRGPKSLGNKKVIYFIIFELWRGPRIYSLVIEDGELENDQSFLQSCFNDKTGNYTQLGNSAGGMQFSGAVLQVRGLDPIILPVTDSSGNALIYNGEILGGISMLPLHVPIEVCCVALKLQFPLILPIKYDYIL